MARKELKKMPSKGERLGWVPLSEAKHIYLTSIVIKGRRMSKVRNASVSNENDQISVAAYLIP